jgi:ERCC4-type nuclease
MILVDGRIGSAQTEQQKKALQQRHQQLMNMISNKGVPVSDYTLPAADFAFEGNGPDGICFIGIEYKHIRDLVNSILYGRLNVTQIPAMTELYQFFYILVEGLYRPHPQTGILETWSKDGWTELDTNGFGKIVMYSQVSRALTTMELRNPHLYIRRTATPNETAYNIVDLFHYWNSKSWDQHTSHLQMRIDNHVELVKSSLLRRVAKEIDKVGWERSGAVDKHFGSVYNMANADIGSWTQIDGIGKVIAERAYKELRNGS